MKPNIRAGIPCPWAVFAILVLALGLACAQAAIPTIYWTGKSDSLWDNPQNWSPSRVPTPSDHVAIASNAPAVQLNVDATVATLQLGGTGTATQRLVIDGRTLSLNEEGSVSTRGVLTFSNGWINTGTKLRLDGAMQWSGGTLAGLLQVEPSGNLSFTEAGDKQLWDNTWLTNRGRISWHDGMVVARGYNGPSTLVNAAGSSFEIHGAGSLFGRYNGYQPFTIRNETNSTMRKFAGANSLLAGVSFFHGGELRVDAGLQLDVDAATTLEHGAAVSGAGLVRNLAGTLTVDGLLLVSGQLLHEAGNLVGTGSNSVLRTTGAGLFQWNGGLLHGLLTLATNSSAGFGGDRMTFADHAEFRNQGTVTWTAGTLAAHCYNGPATLRTTAGGQFIASGGADVVRENGYQLAFFIIEAGAQLRKTGPATITSSWTFNNHGLASMQAGVWRWEGGGTSSGVFSNLSGGTFSFSGGTHTLLNGTRLNGAGRFRADAGVVSADGLVRFGGSGSSAVLELDGDAAIHGSNFVVAGTMVWSNGWVGGLFTVEPTGVITATGPGLKQLEDHARLENRGTINWLGGGAFRASCYNGPATIYNLTNATFQISAAGTPFERWNGYQTFNFINAPGAQFRKTSPGQVVVESIWPDWSGDIRVEAGTLAFNAPSVFRNGVRFRGAGVAAQIGDAITLTGVLTLDGLRYEQRAGDFWMDSAGGVLRTLNNGAFHWQDGVIGGLFAVTNGADLVLNSTASKTLWDNSEIRNLGTITWNAGPLHARAYNGSALLQNLPSGRLLVTANIDLGRENGYHEPTFVNAGTLSLARTNALLSADGWHFSQPVSGVLETVLGGTSPGLSMGRASFNRTAAVGGVVRATLQPGFTPASGQQFTFLSGSPLTGGLQASTLPPLSAGLAWLLDQSSTAASLLLETNPPCVSRPTGLITWLPAEDNAVDVLGQHSGAISGNMQFASGKVGRSFKFDGQDDSVSLGTWFNLQVFSFAMWVKEGDAQQTYADIFDNNHTGFRSFVFQWANSGHTYTFGAAPNGGINVDLTPGVWQHIAITREPGYILRLYRNGQLIGSLTNSSPISYDGSEYLRLGQWGQGGRHWNGQLDEFDIYNRGLSAAEVQSLYAAGMAGKCRNDLPNPVCLPQPLGLVGWWTGDNTTSGLAGAGSATLLNGATFAPGYSAQAFSLDGNDDLVSIGDVTALANATELTLAAWVYKLAGPDNIAGIIAKWDTGPNPAENSFLLFSGEEDYLNRGGFALQFTDGTAGQLKGVATLPVGNWVHIAATWRSSDGQTRIYKNGILDAAGTNGVGRTLRHHTAFPARIGEWGKNNRPNSRWRGLIDEAQIFSRALVSNEIAAIVAAGSQGVCRLSLPDLFVRNVNAPAAAAMSQPIQLSFTITNGGSTLATGVWQNAILLASGTNGQGAEWIGSLTYTGAIPANASVTLTQSVILPSHAFGNRYLGASVDVGDAISELIETNNITFAQVSISIAAPDLVIVSTNAPSSALLGDSITLSYSVSNRGSANAAGQWSDYLYIASDTNWLGYGIYLESIPGEPLSAAAGYSRTRTIPLPLSLDLDPGTYYVHLVVDGAATQSESDDFNNGAWIPISIAYPPLPDLAILSVAAPTLVGPGDLATVNWIVTNAGTLVATGAWVDVITISNATFGTYALEASVYSNSVPVAGTAARSATVRIPDWLPSAPWQVFVSADNASDLFELNEQNNIMAALEPTDVLARLRLTVQPELSEGEGTSATLTRNGDLTVPLNVALSNSHPAHLAVTNTVSFPAGHSTVGFTLAALADGIVDGTNEIRLVATATGYAAATGTVHILDIDVPQLAVALETNVLREGLTVSVTVSRDFRTNEALVVSLQSYDPIQLMVPAQVIIPANQLSYTFAVLAVDDPVIEPTRTHSFEARADGFDSAIASLQVLDNDMPTLVMSLSATEVSEGAGAHATAATVTRTGNTTGALQLQIVSSHPDLTAVPQTVTFAAGAASASFPVGVVDDSVAGSSRVVRLRAIVLDGNGAALVEGAAVSLTVLDDDGPTLKISIARDLVREGQEPATTAVITHNVDTNAAVQVTVSSSAGSELSAPTDTVIPAGARSVTIPLTSLLDGITDGNQSVLVTASAEGFNAGSDVVVVSDIDLPDYVVARVTAPTNGLTGGRISVTYRLENRGIAASTQPFVTRVLLSRDSFVGDDTLLGEFPFDGELPVDLFIDQTAQLRLPEATGRHYILVIADAAAQVAEGLENNNTAISAPIDLGTAYTATVVAGVSNAPIGMPIPLFGSAVRADTGLPAPGANVSLHLIHRGSTRKITATTDLDGNFNVAFTPLPGEAGLFEVGAAHPASASTPVQTSFRVIGMRAAPESITLKVTEQSSATAQIMLHNLSDIPLTGITAAVIDPLPEPLALNLTVASNAVLAGAGTIPLGYAITASTTANALGGTVRVRVSTAEGVRLDIPFNISVEPLRPRLVAYPAELQRSIVRGQQSTLELDIVNAGGTASGPLQISLPGLAWLSLASTNPAPNLLPGETNRVTLLLNPPAEAPLTEFNGTLAINGTNSAAAIPLKVRTISTAIADLRVLAEDEFTYFGEGAPRVTNATVQVLDSVSRNVVTNGTVNAAGEFVVNGLREAYYDVEVSAPKHAPFKQTVLLGADRANDVRAFMSLQLVTYNWTVTPTQTEDRYRITLETTFEANVPAPVITLSPAYLDLSTLDFINGIAYVDFTLENHGLIAADAAQFRLPVHQDYEFTTSVTNLGRIPAQSSLVVPVQVKRKGGVFDRFTGPVIASGQASLTDYVPGESSTSAPAPTDGGPLTPGVSANGSLANEAAVLYRMVVPAGETVAFTFDSTASPATNDLYVRFGAPPTRGSFDFAVTNSLSGDARVVVPTSRAGTYYILVHARNTPNAASPYALTGQLLPFLVTGTSTRQIGTPGLASFRVYGARFHDYTRFALSANGVTNAPVDVKIENAASALVSFDLVGQPAGLYDLIAVQVTNKIVVAPSGDDLLLTEEIAAQVILPQQVQVVQNFPGVVSARVSMPHEVQFGREFPFVVSITNSGGTDIETPLIRVTGRSQARFSSLPGDERNMQPESLLRIIGSTRQQILTPGESVTLMFYGFVNPGANAHIEVQNLSATNGPINWAEFESYYRTQVTLDDWATAWTAFTQAAGADFDGLRGALAATLTALPAPRRDTSVRAEGLLLRTLLPRRAAEPAPLFSSALAPLVTLSTEKRAKIAELPGLPEQCATWRNMDLPLLPMRAGKTLLKGALQSVLFTLYGGEVAGGWDMFMDYDFENSPIPPQRLQFADGSEMVEGARGKPGFRQAEAVKATIAEFCAQHIAPAIREKLSKCKLDCHNLPSEMTLEELFEGTGRLEAAYAAFTEGLDFHDEPAGIPSNTAGGRSGSFRGTKDEGRLLKGSKIKLKPTRSGCGNLTRLDIETDLLIQYDDSLDFCPGGLAECREFGKDNRLKNDSAIEIFRATAVELAHNGTCPTRVASVALQILEAYELAYSVPFTVTFKADPYTYTDFLGKFCPQKCCPPARIGIDYSYQCGGNAVAKGAEGFVNNGPCQPGAEGLPDCQTTGQGFSGLPPFAQSPPPSGAADSGGADMEFSLEVPCTPATAAAAAKVSKEQASSAKAGNEVCAKVKLALSQDLVSTRDTFKATLEIINGTASPLDAVLVNIVIRDENGNDATDLFGIRPPELDGLSVNGTAGLAGNTSGKASWVLIPTIDAATNGPTQYYVSGSFAYTLNGLRVTVPMAPAPITAMPSASLVLRYFHERDVFSDDPYTPVVEPSIPFSLAVMIENSGKGTANNLKITSAQPKIVDNEKGLLIDFRIIGTEVAGQAQEPSLTATFGSIAPGDIAVGRWLLTSTLQGLFIDYSARFEHLDAIGTKRLSIIDRVEIHEMNHLVHAVGSFEDGRPDFLVNDVEDPNDLPDTIYFSQGGTSSVHVVAAAQVQNVPTADSLMVQLTAPMPAGWTYLRISDPANGAFRLARVMRSDGVEIPLGTNAWITPRTFIGQGKRPITENILHLLDHGSTGSYELQYASLPPVDTHAASSSVAALPDESYSQFAITWAGADGPDGSGIAYYDIYVSVDGGPFTIWLPRTSSTSSVYPGTPGHNYAFYSVAVDVSGNREAAPISPDALTTTSLSNSAPVLSLASSVSIDEGQTLVLNASATDADPGQSLSYILGPGAPAGVLLSAAGQITWTTGEGSGPGTNRISVIVADNGVPSMTATAAVTVVVNEVNAPPTLSAVTNRVANELKAVSVAFTASDSDLPAQRLTFAFASSAPDGATLDANTGLFSWTPSSLQGPSTNTIRVSVRDNGLPSFAATQSFVIVVRDSRPDFVVSLGTTNVIAGQPGSIPVVLQSGLDLTNITLLVDLSAHGLTNLALSPADASVGQALLSPVAPQQFRLRLSAAQGDVLQGFGDYARLSFDTSSDAPSALVRLQSHTVTGIRASGELISNGGGSLGRVIVVNDEPVLAPLSHAPRQIEVFARPGMSYRIEYSTGLGEEWIPVQTINNPPQLRSVIEVNVPAPTMFLRAVVP